ncbi:unnamed protein product, partial [Phaeothamnion confervicola]
MTAPKNHAQVRRERLSLTEFFAGLDPLRKGVCSPAAFQRAIARAFLMPLTAVQLAALAEAHSAPNGTVAYQQFIDRIEAAAAAAGAATSAGEAAKAAAAAAAPPTATLRGMRTRLSHECLQLKPAFRGFDPRREQHVTVGQFVRVLGTFGLLPPAPAAAAALARHYGSANDLRRPVGSYVHYMAFLADLESRGDDADADGSRTAAALGPQAAAAARTAARLRRDAEAVLMPARSAAEIVAGLRGFVLRHALRPQEFFKDEDRMRRRRITRERFGRSLQGMGVKLSPADFQALAAAYSSSGPEKDHLGQLFVRWADLCDDLERVFTVRRLEAQPDIDVAGAIAAVRGELIGTAMAGAAAMAVPATTGLPLPPAATDEAAAGDVDVWLAAAAEEVRRRRLELSRPLESFDRLATGRVPASKFNRALDAAGLRPPRRVSELLTERFRVAPTDPFSALPTTVNSVNYRAFLTALWGSIGCRNRNDGDCDGNSGGGSGGGLMPGNGTVPPPPSTPPPAAASVTIAGALAAAAAQLLDSRADLLPLLAAEDPLRCGAVAPSRVCAALTLAGAELSPAALEALQRAFASVKLPGHIDYRALAAAIDGAWARGGVGGTGDGAGADGAAVALQKALARVRDAVRTRRLDLRSRLRDLDRGHHRRVSPRRFAAALTDCGVGVTAAEATAIAAAYGRPGAGRRPNAGVDFAAFCVDIE